MHLCNTSYFTGARRTQSRWMFELVLCLVGFFRARAFCFCDGSSCARLCGPQNGHAQETDERRQRIASLAIAIIYNWLRLTRPTQFLRITHFLRQLPSSPACKQRRRVTSLARVNTRKHRQLVPERDKHPRSGARSNSAEACSAALVRQLIYVL